MKDDGEVEAAVIEFVVRETSANRSRLSLDTRLREDIGIDGADAVDFFEHFASTFGVDLSGFDISRHFGPEASFNPLHSIFGTQRHWVETTIRDLTRAVRLKRWSE